MDPLTLTAASGLRARMESLDMLANNMANAATTGYKGDREFYSLYLAPEAEGSDRTLPVIEKLWTDHAQGTLVSTGSPFDLALEGRGFFTVTNGKEALYTRNGNFHLSPAGALVTAEGYPVRLRGAVTLTLDPLKPFEIHADGAVRQQGNTLGQLDLAHIADPIKRGDNYFTAEPSQAKAAAAKVHQHKLEGSNVGAAESAVRLISVMRQFESLQKAIAIGGEMNRKAFEEVARVGS